MGSVYLDYNATTPLEKDVIFTIQYALTEAWGNPSSSHEAGKKAKKLIDEARLKVSQMIGAIPDEIIFTSGGTESNNMVIYSAIKYFAEYFEKRNYFSNMTSVKPHIITTNIEHDSVKLPLETLSKSGEIEVTFVPVSKLTGQIVIEDIINSIRPQTCLITVMMANNETGIIQPISDLGLRITSLNATRLKQQNSIPPVLFHTDAAQAIGKIEVNVSSLYVDYLTIVGHKFYGPRIGAIYFKIKEKYSNIIYPIFYGGGQEKKYRPGTENTAMIAGLGVASELVHNNLASYQENMRKMKNYLEKSLKDHFKDKICFNNARENVPCLPNTTSVAFLYENITGPMILSKALKICSSTTAACHHDSKPSSILVLSGVSPDAASKSLRLSIGRETTQQDINVAVANLCQVISNLCNTVIKF